MQLPKAQTLSLSLGRTLPRILSLQAFDESCRQGGAALICPWLAHPPWTVFQHFNHSAFIGIEMITKSLKSKPHFDKTS